MRTDYLLVVWAPDLTKFTKYNLGIASVNYQVKIHGNLFEYPSGTVVGYTEFRERKGRSCCFVGNSEGDDVNEMINDIAAQIAEKLSLAAYTEKAKS